MARIVWKDHYSIGYKDIDAQHRVLLDLLNELIDLMDQGGLPEDVASFFQSVSSYAMIHFSNEEQYLKAAAYPGLAPQEAEHSAFIQQLLVFNQAYDSADSRLLEETQSFLRHWFLNHILVSDMAYASFMKRYRSEATIKAVLFDFGNVVCRFDNDRFLAGLAALCGQSAEVLKALLYGQSTLIEDYEAGRIDSQAFLAGASDLCGMALPEAEFRRAYTDIFTPMEATFELIRKLKPSYRIGLVSNTSPWHFEDAIQTSPVFPWFDSVTLSYQVGASKPDPRLFEDALTKLDLMAEECVYIDDLAPFAQAANRHLMHGLTYTTPVALMTELRRLKVTY